MRNEKITLVALLLSALCTTLVNGYLSCNNSYAVISSSPSGDVTSRLTFDHPLVNILDNQEWKLELTFSADVEDFNVGEFTITIEGIEVVKELFTTHLNIIKVTDFRSFILQRKLSPNTSLGSKGTFHMTLELIMKSKNNEEPQLIYARLNNHSLCTSHRHRGCGLNVKESRLLMAHGKEIDYGEWPWMAAIYVSGSGRINYQCGGTLISARHLTTAAHCIVNGAGRVASPDQLTVYLGRHLLTNFEDRETEVQSFKVFRTYVHSDWNKYKNGKKDADIAVIFLAESATFTHTVQPVCLFGNPVTNATIGNVIGWGMDESGQISDVPKIVTMPAFTGDECEKTDSRFVLEKIVSNRTFCAGNRDGSGPCKGDSGSGLYTMARHIGDHKRHYLSGIVSRTLNTKIASNTENEMDICDLYQLVVFTDVLSFRHWIECILYDHNCLVTDVRGIEISHPKSETKNTNCTREPQIDSNMEENTTITIVILSSVIAVLIVINAMILVYYKTGERRTKRIGWKESNKELIRQESQTSKEREKEQQSQKNNSVILSFFKFN